MHNLVKSSVVEHEHSPGSFPVNIRIHLLNFDLPIPAIVSIPGQEGSMGYGMNNLRRAVERAVGADILFKDTN